MPLLTARSGPTECLPGVMGRLPRFYLQLIQALLPMPAVRSAGVADTAVATVAPAPHFSHRWQMGTVITFIVFGLSLVIWPQLLSPLSKRRHAERLQELRSGEAEEFFEERRSLETYRPTGGPLIWRRLLGAMMIAAAVALLAMPRLANGE